MSNNLPDNADAAGMDTLSSKNLEDHLLQACKKIYIRRSNFEEALEGSKARSGSRGMASSWCEILDMLCVLS